MSVLFALSSEEYVCRKVCHPILLIPISAMFPSAIGARLPPPELPDIRSAPPLCADYTSALHESLPFCMLPCWQILPNISLRHNLGTNCWIYARQDIPQIFRNEQGCYRFAAEMPAMSERESAAFCPEPAESPEVNLGQHALPRTNSTMSAGSGVPVSLGEYH